MRVKNIDKQKKIILDTFPVQFSENIIYNLLSNNIDVIYNEKERSRKYIVDIIDNYGYKYHIDFHHMMSSRGRYDCLNRFFYGNIYTYDNINLYCKLNNIDLYIDGKDLPVIGVARKKMDYVDSKGNIVNTSWNQIKHYSFRYQNNYEEIKRQNYENTHMTKEKAIPIIMKKYEELQRPLLQRDFQGVETTDTSIGIRIIYRLWGTFTNMIKELGLPEHDYYYKPFDKNYRPHEEVMESIKTVCEVVKSQGRTTVLYPDFKEIADISEISTIRRHCELDGTNLRDVIKSYGCELQQCGNGMNHRFEDGEYTSSKYEYDFSRFLRDNGFEYGKTYFRNIYYKKLDNEYSGNMNCDYCIDFDGQLVYIELAGILGNKEHQDAYRNNTPLKSKSKEEYRLKLNQKREMFERNNLEYYILLPDEMNEETYKNILKKYLKEAV